MPTVCYANLKSLFQSDFLAPLFISFCKPYEQQFMGYTSCHQLIIPVTTLAVELS